MENKNLCIEAAKAGFVYGFCSAIVWSLGVYVCDKVRDHVACLKKRRKPRV